MGALGEDVVELGVGGHLGATLTAGPVLSGPEDGGAEALAAVSFGGVPTFDVTEGRAGSQPSAQEGRPASRKPVRVAPSDSDTRTMSERMPGGLPARIWVSSVAWSSAEDSGHSALRKPASWPRSDRGRGGCGSSAWVLC